MEEIWKDISGYEGLYQVSNLGKVKSLRRSKILMPYDNLNYKQVSLHKLGSKKVLSVHRLVASAFLGLDLRNKNIFVCHKDDNPGNNNIDNLFLGTHQDNMDDMNKKGRNPMVGKFGYTHHNSKEIYQIKEGIILNKFSCAWEATRITGIPQSNICNVCLGKRKSAGGYNWKFTKKIANNEKTI